MAATGIEAWKVIFERYLLGMDLTEMLQFEVIVAVRSKMLSTFFSVCSKR